MKVGDLVRAKTEYDYSHIRRVYRFRLATEDIRYVESSDLEGKMGLVVLSQNTCNGYSEVYRVVFGNIVIQISEQWLYKYFEKLEKTLNKNKQPNV